MDFQNMSFVGVVSSEEQNMTFIMLREMMIREGYILIYKNKEENILFFKKINKHIGLIEITPSIAEGLLNLNLNFQVLIHTFLDEEDYSKKAIQDLFNQTKNFVILNIDEERSIDLVEDNDEALVVTYGFNKKSTATASSLQINNVINFNFCLQRQITTLNNNEIEPFEMPIKLDLIGRWNIYYALATIIAGICYNVKINIIYETLKDIKNSRREYEKLYDNDFLVLDNYCKNSLDFSLTFETIQNLKYREIIILLGIEIDKGIISIKKYIDVIISWFSILGVNSLFFYLDSKNKLIEDNIKFILDKKGIDFYIYYDLKLCIGKAINLLNKNDILLLVGGECLNMSKKIVNLELANKL